MRPTLSPGVLTLCLCFGIGEALGVLFFAMLTGGYAFVDLRPLELAHLWAFLIVGPTSAFLAGILVLWRARWGAESLIVGGVSSAVLAVPYLPTDAHILPLALVSLPMVLVGLWLLWLSRRSDRLAGEAERPADAPGQPPFSAGVGPVLLRTLLFLVGFIGTLELFRVLDAYNVTGLPHPSDPDPSKNVQLAYPVLLLFMAAGAGLISFIRKWLLVRVEVLVGMWLALLVLTLPLLPVWNVLITYFVLLLLLMGVAGAGPVWTSGPTTSRR